MRHELNWLPGKVVTQVEYDDQTDEWAFVMTDHAVLYGVSYWNIIVKGRVSLASGDHGQKYGLSAPIDAAARATILLAELKIKTVTVDPFSADLTISFEDETILRTFNNSSGFEGWQLKGPRGEMIIAQGGGNVVWFPERGED